MLFENSDNIKKSYNSKKAIADYVSKPESERYGFIVRSFYNRKPEEPSERILVEVFSRYGRDAESREEWMSSAAARFVGVGGTYKEACEFSGAIHERMEKAAEAMYTQYELASKREDVEGKKLAAEADKAYHDFVARGRILRALPFELLKSIERAEEKAKEKFELKLAENEKAKTMVKTTRFLEQFEKETVKKEKK